MRQVITCLFLIWAYCVSAQSTPLFCGFDHAMKMKCQHDPSWKRSYDEIFSKCREQGSSRGGGVYTLPVVVHVVYHLDNENIPDSVVLSQMEVLNEDYRRTNPDAINTRDIFLPFAADMDIQFALASIDPEGNPTTGITHTYTDRESFDFDLFSQDITLNEVKHSETGGVDAWDPLHYINIWVCNVAPTPFGQIFGLSFPPEGLDNWPAGSSAPTPGDEGLIVHYTTVGRNNPVANEDGTEFNNNGRTMTHEMGHYLGLRHTWGDEFLGDPCSEDDGIDDTPICGSGDQYVCDYEANTCDDGSENDLPDMLENYMDYTQDACYNMFTEGQKTLMRYVIENLRSDLLDGVNVAENTSALLPVYVWPNPASERLYASIPANEIYLDYSISDASGRIVETGRIDQSGISLLGMEAGHYLISFRKDGKSKTEQFIVNAH